MAFSTNLVHFRLMPTVTLTVLVILTIEDRCAVMVSMLVPTLFLGQRFCFLLDKLSVSGLLVSFRGNVKDNDQLKQDKVG